MATNRTGNRAGGSRQPATTSTDSGSTRTSYLARLDSDTHENLLLASTALQTNKNDAIVTAINYFVDNGLVDEVAKRRAASDEAIKKLSGG